MKLVSFDDELKKLYTLSGEPTTEGKAMLERMAAERIERNKDIAGLIDERGRTTAKGRERIHDLIDTLRRVTVGHDDNCGASCRIDLDGHDCCCLCNMAEDMLRATAKYYKEPK